LYLINENICFVIYNHLKINVMLWKGRRESDNVEDRRGVSGKGIAVGGGATAIIVIALKFLFGGDINIQDISSLTQGSTGTATEVTSEQQKAQDERAQFVKVVLADTEDVWGDVFKQSGMTYQSPSLVLFSDATESACGAASSQSGPFYCPGDQKVYIDLTFYNDLRGKFGARGGDFAQAYVIAHEIGHHIQYLLGISEKMDRLRGCLSEQEYNRYSVCLELQADFFAGLWGHYEQGKGYLEKDDLADALNSAQVIGDDNLQKASQGYVTPETFTHGTSEQRMYWLKKGFETGDMKQCDTFKAAGLSL
jgi:predicted metalloprotease